METLSVLPDFCEWHPPAIDEFHWQRPVMQSFDVFFDVTLAKLLKDSRRIAGDLKRHHAHATVM